MLIGEGESNDFWRKQGEGQKSMKLLKICVPGNLKKKWISESLPQRLGVFTHNTLQSLGEF